MAVKAAFPFIKVDVDTSALVPVGERAPGVIAVIGKSDGGTAPVNSPVRVTSAASAVQSFKAGSALTKSLQVALRQEPQPDTIYGVKANGDDYAGALTALEAADDVTFVALANETDATRLGALKTHIEEMSDSGQKRIGVAMVDPDTAKSPTYVADVKTAVAALRSDSSRMVLIAARGAVADATGGGDVDIATAAMAAIAGQQPHVSVVLKRVRGFKMPVEGQYSPAEIIELSEAGINPVIDPALIVGEGLHLADGRCFTTDESLLFIDTLRVVDDIDFRLKAGLIGTIGDARITKAGMTLVKLRTESILAPLKRRAVIDDYAVAIDVLDVLNLPESAWTPADKTLVETARANRAVEVSVQFTYGPAVHRLVVTVAPKF